MITLVQRQIPTDHARWEDIRIPTQTGLPPERGEQPLVETVSAFAEQLRHAGLDGVYRAFFSDGSIWRVTIEKTEVYVADVTMEPV